MQRGRCVIFIGAFFVSIAGFLAIGMATLAAVDRLGHLPPPPLTATNCIDEKFKFINRQATDDPDLLAVGSSVTWRNLNFSALDVSAAGFARPLNGAPCYLSINQTAWLADFYLDNFSGVRAVISVLAMRDFEGCDDDGALFDATLGRQMMFSDLPEALIYFVNFRPRRLLADALHIKAMRSGENLQNPLVMDKFGSGPLRNLPTDPRDDVSVSPACYGHLRQMEQNLERRGVRWIVVLMPAMPAWQKLFDPAGIRDRDWRTTVASTLQSDNTALIDGATSPFNADRYFVDPAHFQWRWTGDFTQWIFGRLRAPQEQESVGTQKGTEASRE